MNREPRSILESPRPPAVLSRRPGPPRPSPLGTGRVRLPWRGAPATVRYPAHLRPHARGWRRRAPLQAALRERCNTGRRRSSRWPAPSAPLGLPEGRLPEPRGPSDFSNWPCIPRYCPYRFSANAQGQGITRRLGARKRIHQQGLIIPKIALARLQPHRHCGVAVRCCIFKRSIDVPQHTRSGGLVLHAPGSEISDRMTSAWTRFRSTLPGSRSNKSRACQ